MRGWFYQANFCAECGNRRTRRRWWQHSYLCADCAARVGRRRYLVPTICALCGLIVGLALNSRRQETALERITLPGLAASPVVSALDATAHLKPARLPEAEQYTICGARTKKGTPCRRRTRPGQRCAQHQGRLSMLPEPAPRSEASTLNPP
jgi:hypothetical protein